MKRLLSYFFLLFFIGTMTDAFALTNHFVRELKCPRCKMKIEKKGGCPCHKKKATPLAVLHDPCGDDEGDFSISFDRILGVVSSASILPVRFDVIYTVPFSAHLASRSGDIPWPPPRA